MCIIFLASDCPSKFAGGELKLVTSLENGLEIGRCVDPTSASPIHCAKLQVRHKLAWYDKCQWCTEMATLWREGKVNELAEYDKVEVERLDKRKSFEMEILKREEEIAKKTKENTTNETEGHQNWAGRCCALSS